MVDLAESSRPIDAITLIEELEQHKELEAVGDIAYVSELVDGVPERPSIAHYIKIVRDKALLRATRPLLRLHVRLNSPNQQNRFWTRRRLPSSSYRKSASTATSCGWKRSSIPHSAQ